MIGISNGTQSLNSTIGNGDSNKSFKDILSGSDEQTETSQKEFSLDDLQKKFEVGSVRKISSTQTERKAATMKAECLKYLLLLLMGGKQKKLSLFESEDSSSVYQDALSSSTNDLMASDLSEYLISYQAAELDMVSCYNESEKTSFSTTGSVVTSDGRSMDFQLNLQMSRSFTQYYEESYQMPDLQLCDPLVINLDMEAAEMTDQTFYFDIDADGVKDNIHRLNGKSGYLALDKNGDGKINDGTELFGTKSGDGFKDLQKYDTDHDGWIDEDDDIWDKLTIWSQDENGNDVLCHLEEKGVGAICLQSADTQYAQQDKVSGEINGVIRRTGMFLFENGMAGTVQHLDVAKA